MKIQLSDCIAKTMNKDEPGCTVVDHLRLTGFFAKCFYERCSNAIRNRLPFELLVSLSILHDVGKISPGFQRKIWRAVRADMRVPSVSELCFGVNALLDVDKQTDHSFIGGNVLNDLLGGWSKVILRHHGTERNHTSIFGDKFGDERWDSLREEAIKELFSEFQGSFDVFKRIIPTRELIDLATGFVVVCDWLSSDERNFEVFSTRKFNEQAENALNDVGFIRAQRREEQSFNELFGFEPNELQRKFYDICSKPGIYVIESSTGSGKTEAALWGAYRLLGAGNEGLYFALPTRTTSNKIHERVEPFIERVFGENVGVRLTHGLSWTERDDEADDWFNSSKRGMLQEFGVGTVDQSLLGVLNVKHNFLRLFGLAGKVVIVDEAHTYDEYTGGVLDALLRRLERVGTTVIILSATLTAKRRSELLCSKNAVLTESYPLISYRHYGSTEERVEIERERSRVVRVKKLEPVEDFVNEASLAIAEAERGSLVLCVKNTINKAQKLYRQILSMNKRVDSRRIGVLHSRFSSRRRNELEDKFLGMYGKRGDRSSGAILVSTQIVEQSVDIDADVLITELCPIDMLIQRVGRLWRHNRVDRPILEPCVFLVSSEFSSDKFVSSLGVDSFVYEPYVLWRTLDALRGRDVLSLPSDVRTLLEMTYSERDEVDKTVLEMKNRANKNKATLKRKANAATGTILPQCKEDALCRTRYDNEPQTYVLIVRDVLLNPTRIITLSGKEIKVDGYYRRTDAIDLTKDVIIRRKASLDDEIILDDVSKRLFNMYFKRVCGDFHKFMCLRLENNSSDLTTLDGNDTSWLYTDNIGLYLSETNPVIVTDEIDFKFDETDW